MSEKEFIFLIILLRLFLSAWLALQDTLSEHLFLLFFIQES